MLKSQVAPAHQSTNVHSDTTVPRDSTSATDHLAPVKATLAKPGTKQNPAKESSLQPKACSSSTVVKTTPLGQPHSAETDELLDALNGTSANHTPADTAGRLTIRSEDGRINRTVAQFPTPTKLFVYGTVSGHAMSIRTDDGADVSVISRETAENLNLKVRPTTMKLFGPDGKPLKCLGYINTSVDVVDPEAVRRDLPKTTPFQSSRPPSAWSRDDPNSPLVAGSAPAPHNTRRLPLMACVVEGLKEDILLGRNFLAENRVILDYSDSTISVPTANGKRLQISAVPSTTSQSQDEANTIRELVRQATGPGTASHVNSTLRASHKWRSMPEKQREGIFGILGLLKPSDTSDIATIIVPFLDNLYAVFTPESDPSLRDRQVTVINKKLKEAWQRRPNPAPWTASLEPVFTLEGQLYLAPRGATETQIAAICQVVLDQTGSHPLTQLPPPKAIQKHCDLEKEVMSWSHLPAAERRHLLQVLRCYDETTLQCQVLPRVRDFEAKIVLMEDAHPVKMRDRNWNPDQLAAIRKDIDELLKNGWITKCYGSWAARLVPVIKSDGTIRMCADYRALNDRTKADAYPSANPDTIMDRLHGKAFFSKLDAMKGYYQIKIDDASKELTGFTCPFGFFQFEVMPFGLKNAPAIFQRMMDEVLDGYAGIFCDVLIDDILIYSDTFPEHLDHIQLVLERLKDRNIALRFDKCQFAVTELYFLGHIINREGKRADPEKVTAVQNMVPPVNKQQLRSFLGMAGYLRRYIKNFADEVAPLTDLTTDGVPDKDITGHWTPVHLIAFERIKKLLTTAPVLTHPDFNRPFIIETDASDYAVGAMLAQEYKDEQNRVVNRPIAYISAKLNRAQKNYDVTNREGLACIWAMDKFEHYLKRHPVTIITDHNPLTTMQTRKHAAQRIERWRQRMQEFRPIFIYRSGAKHHSGDCLSRLDCPGQPTLEHDHDQVAYLCQVTVPAASEPLPPWKDDSLRSQWVKAQIADPLLSQLRTAVQSQQSPKTSRARHFLRVYRECWTIREDGLLYLIHPTRSSKSTTPLDMTATSTVAVAVPFSLRPSVLEHVHGTGSNAGHYGVRKIFPLLEKTCWWPHMYRDLERHVMDCLVCQRFRRGPHNHVPQQEHLNPTKPMDVVAVDAVALPRTPMGVDKALTVVDLFTNFAWCFPMTDIQAETVAETLRNRVFNTFGWPATLLADNGTEFRNHVIIDMCKDQGTKCRFITTGNPQSNGRVEVQNKTLIHQLQTACGGDRTAWPKNLTTVVHTYNTTPILDTDITPYEMMFGYKPRRRITATPESLDPDDLTPQHRVAEVEAAKTQATSLRTTRQTVAREAANAKAKSKDPDLKPGQLVWTHNLDKLAATGRDRDFKLDPLWIGPYVIVKPLNPVSFSIRPLGDRTLQTLHASHLKAIHDDQDRPISLDPRYIQDTEQVAPKKAVSTRQRGKVKGPTYDVTQVLQHRWTDSRLEFLLAFKGYDTPSWTHELKLSCADLVRKYVLSLVKVSAIGRADAKPE